MKLECPHAHRAQGLRGRSPAGGWSHPAAGPSALEPSALAMQSPGQCGTLARGQNGVTVFYNPGISISEPTYNPDTYNPQKNAHASIIQKKMIIQGFIIQKSYNPEKSQPRQKIPLCAFVATNFCFPQIYNPKFIIQRENCRNH